MLKEAFGELCTAQDLLAGATDSENVILLTALANVGFGKVWWSVICETANTGGTTDTYVFALVVATEEALNTYRTIMTVPIVGSADPRIAAVRRNIANFEVGHQIAEVADASYKYLGMISTLADVNGTAAVGINADMLVSKPRTRDGIQVVESNVQLPS